MNEFRISSSLRLNIENILARRCVEYIIFESDSGLRIKVGMSGESFHKVVLRAKMEKLMEEKKSNIPFVAASELNDLLVKQEVGEVYIVTGK